MGKLFQLYYRVLNLAFVSPNELRVRSDTSRNKIVLDQLKQGVANLPQESFTVPFNCIGGLLTLLLRRHLARYAVYELECDIANPPLLQCSL